MNVIVRTHYYPVHIHVEFKNLAVLNCVSLIPDLEFMACRSAEQEFKQFISVLLLARGGSKAALLDPLPRVVVGKISTVEHAREQHLINWNLACCLCVNHSDRKCHS